MHPTKLSFAIVTIAINCIASLAATPAPEPAPPTLVKNIVTDYGANPHMPQSQVTALVQQAVDDVGRAGGGTVIIPSSQLQWWFDKPIFVGYPNVTIAGQGRGTWINSRGILL